MDAEEARGEDEILTPVEAEWLRQNAENGQMIPLDIAVGIMAKGFILD